MRLAPAVAGGFTALSPLNRSGGSGGGSFGGVCSHSNGRMKVMWLGHKASVNLGEQGSRGGERRMRLQGIPKQKRFLLSTKQHE